MYVELDARGEATLEEVDVFNDFKIVVSGRDPRSLAPGDVAGFGRLDDDRLHVWVDPHWLRNAGPATAEWRVKLSRLAAFAQTKGWCDAEGRIRAHFEAARAG